MKNLLYQTLFILVAFVTTAQAQQRNIFSILKDTTGGYNIVGDYSSNARNFYFTNTNSETAYITRCLISIQDVGQFDTDKYGKDIVLTNGITVDVVDENGTQVLELTRFPIIAFEDWAMHCYDHSDPNSTSPNGTATVIIRWTWERSGLPIKLPFGYKIRLSANDDFSDLLKHYFIIDGFYANSRLRKYAPYTY